MGIILVLWMVHHNHVHKPTAGWLQLSRDVGDRFLALVAEGRLTYSDLATLLALGAGVRWCGGSASGSTQRSLKSILQAMGRRDEKGKQVHRLSDSVRRLEAVGWLVRERRGGVGKPNVYRVDPSLLSVGTEESKAYQRAAFEQARIDAGLAPAEAAS